MEDASGEIFKICNSELHLWKQKFLELEGIDIHNAAAVAVASLEAAIREGKVRQDEIIMLNITGGGEERAKAENEVVYAKPMLVLDPDLPAEDIVSQVLKLFN